MSCNCQSFTPIELTREALSKRIKDTITLKLSLEKVEERREVAQELLKCKICGKYWQSSYAWNWGDKQYLFKVPEITKDEWKEIPYQQPDELIIYSAVLNEYFEKNTFNMSENSCRREQCGERAISYSVFCLDHHLVNLQEKGVLPKEPKGRKLPEYM